MEKIIRRRQAVDVPVRVDEGIHPLLDRIYCNRGLHSLDERELPILIMDWAVS